MKLVIQIPCYNEAKTLPDTLRDLPTTLPGIDEIEILVIDDGSTDETVAVAKEHGVHRVISFPYNQGLAKAFARGLQEAAHMDADILVNTDADNQYPGKYIQDLIVPIVTGNADMVVGCRAMHRIQHFSPTKKRLQRLGSKMVMWLTGAAIPDVTSGFRAYSARAVREIKVFSDFTYTVETIIQAARSGLQLQAVEIDINPPTRPSRLFHSNFYYIRRQATTILRIWAMYSPGKLFNDSGLASLATGSLLLARFVFYYFISYPEPSGKVQSLIVASILMSLGFSLLLFGVVTDLIGVNRHLMEDTLNRLDNLERKLDQNDDGESE